MLALGIRYLNGWAMAAADGAKKEQAEWPPHPDRVFMALAAAWFETDQDPAEQAALHWLENLGPPQIAASDKAERHADHRRGPTTSYVPVNDTRLGRKPPMQSNLDKLKDAGLELLPEHRGRQARNFPVAIPHHPDVHLIWPEHDPTEYHAALTQLARKVTHIGHSASFVQVWLDPEPPKPRWQPVTGAARHRLRIVTPGRLANLERICNRDATIAYRDLQAQIKHAKGKEKTMLKKTMAERFGDQVPQSHRPESGLWQGYDLIDRAELEPLPGSLFDPRLLVFRLSGRQLSLPATLRLTNALRCTLLKRISEHHGTVAPTRCNGETDNAAELEGRFGYPEWISGHRADGRASADPHLAMLPLPFVGHEHADGRLMGIALALPRKVDPTDVGRWIEPLLRDEEGWPEPIHLFDGQWLETEITLESSETPPFALRPEVWTAARTGACRWASVTPVVLDRHFNGADKWQKAAESVKDACERVGLPRPLEVQLHPTSRLRGAPKANEFPRMRRKRDGGEMAHIHAFLQFGEPVQGPIMIGAGRFRGYGLCRPLAPCRKAGQEGEHHG